MQHQNINQFLGACPEPDNLCIVSVYCAKGSLEDVLENENIKLDSVFKMSFVSDITEVCGKDTRLYKSLIGAEYPG